MNAFCAQSCLTLCNPMDCSPPGPLCPWVFPGKNTGVGLPFPSPGDLPNPEIEPMSPAFAGRFFTTAPPGKPGKEDIRCKLRKSEYFMDFNNNILILADEL